MALLNNEINNTKGIIYDIQRFSIHDGPGIRTIVFLKGCPLSCKWCSNPESQEIMPEMMGQKLIGKEVTVKEVIEKVVRDMPFYEESGGGLTLSGGEPLMQSEFAKNLILAAKKKNIHTAIETSLYQSWDKLWEVIKHVDYTMFDIKFSDKEKYQKFVGGDLELVQSNIIALLKKKNTLKVRVPLIPYFNDDKESIDEIGEFCKSVGIKAIELLPYHRLGENKYEQMNREYELKGILPLNPKDACNIAGYLTEKYNIEVFVL